MTNPEVGIVLGTIAEVGDDGSTLANIPASAREVEQAGLDSVWVADVITGDGRPSLESMTVLGAAAGATERVGLGTCILALPLRQIAWTATQLQTLQFISGNRLVLGVGIGGFPGSPFWSAAGAPVRRRGAWMDAALETLPRLVAGESVRTGDDPDAAPIALQPAAPMPPLRIAGNAEAALARAVRNGGWFGGGAGSLGPQTVAPAVTRLREIAAERGVDPPRVTVAPEVTVGVGASAWAVREERNRGLVEAGFLSEDDVARIPVAQTAEHAAEVFASYVEVGVDEIVTGPTGDGADRLRGLELIAEARALLRVTTGE